MHELILRGGTVLGPDGPRLADVAIDDGIVSEVGDLAQAEAARELESSGTWVGPGLVDLHAHLREPGQEWKEDIASGSAAAAAGGYTAVVAMPNTDPPTDAGHLARYIADRGRSAGLIDVVPAGCLTAGREGFKLAHLDDLWDAGVRVFSDDGDTVADAGLLRRAMEYLAQLGGVVAQHAIDPGLSRGGHMHEGTVSSRLGMQGVPAEAEEAIIARDLALVRLTGVAYHCQHVSTARAIELIAAAKAEGLPVTAEVTPHHLMFDHSEVEGTRSNYKMMPPLRTADDVAALREALRRGVVDAVATDHAPHAAHEKDVPFEEAPFGVTGLEWAAAATHTAVDLGPEDFFTRLSGTPARIAGLGSHGRWIEPGVEANLCAFDPNVDEIREATLSKSANSPFLGMRLRGSVRHTIHRGAITWSHGMLRTEVTV